MPISEIEAAAGAQQPGLEGQARAPGSSSTFSGTPDADTAASTTPVSQEEDADAPEGPSEAPAVSAQEEDVGVDESAEAAIDNAVPAEPSPAAEAVSPPSTEEPANDNNPADPLPATGTDG
jgi:hypothetical protein